MIRYIEPACFVAFAALALLSDIRNRRLPNRLTVAGLAAALLLRAFAGPAAVLDGLGAGLAALAISLPLFAVGGIGGGDAKLLAALGAFAGLQQLWPALLTAGVLGGVLALALTIRGRVVVAALLNVGALGRYILSGGRRGSRPRLDSPGAIRVPYGVAIALGFVAARFLPLARWV